MDEIVYHPIGVIRTPFSGAEGMPVQPPGAAAVEGRVVLREELTAGLDDLDGFSHLILIYHFHRTSGYDLTVTPFLDDHPRGLFATRAPRRPNAVGISVVSLVRRQEHVLHVRGIDVIDGTPLLDIKPHVPDFDAPAAASSGWLAGKLERAEAMRADRRFVGESNDQ